MKNGFAALLLVSLMPCLVSGEEWSRFRGPNGSGRIENTTIPTKWSSSENLKWRTELPGKGSSSPALSADHVFVTAYTGYGLSPEDPGDVKNLVRHLLAFDRATGKELWRKSVEATAEEDPYAGFITQHGYASSTPAVDDNRVYALLGKSGLYAFDFEGNQLWHADLGQMSDPAKWGDATSPIVVGDLVIVDAGVLGHKFAAFDKATGEQRWEIANPAFTNAWATPAVVEVNGKEQVLFNVPKHVHGVDPSTGKILWSIDSPLEDAATGSVIVSGDTAYLMGSRAGHAMAVRCGGSGDVSATNTVWSSRLQSGICTPLIVGQQMYWCTGGIFFAASLETGEYVYKERLPRLGGATGGFPNVDYSSAIAIDNKIVQFTRSGESYVVEPGSEFKLIAHNPSFEGDSSAFSATPAASHSELFVRSEAYLYCISK